MLVPVIEFIYTVCLAGLGLYGLNCWILTLLFLRHRHDSALTPPPPAEWPHVTVQLPIYNELHTVERLLAAAGRLDYPRGRLQIQALDDSTDETRQVVARAVERLRRQGIDAVQVTRPDRGGYKAGALTAGLACTRGELIAILDADFVPQPDFLRRVVPQFADPTIGCVQTRWGHINRSYSLLTRAQAVAMDGHFIVEQGARSRSGLFLNFNGTAGVWRRVAIEQAGGWHGDTLTEDLDLSYRAQLCGWRIAYLGDVVVPAELPAQISAFRKQQARWAQGSIQTALKMIGPLLRSRQPAPVKLEGLVHLLGYGVNVLMLAMLLLSPFMSFFHGWAAGLAPWLMLAGVGPPLLYTVAQVAQGGRRPYERLALLPILVLLGLGMALSDSWAVLKAVLGLHEEFQRTPKYALHGARGSWVDSAYALGWDSLVWGELALALFALALLALRRVGPGFAPWLLLYAGGLAYVAGLSIQQSFQRRRWRARQPKPAARAEEQIARAGRENTLAGWPGRGR